VSVVVDLAELAVHIERFGPRAFLMTSASEDPPHVASVLVTMKGDDLVMRAGRRTLANAEARPAVTLVWSSPNEHEHCLIVDGTAQRATDEHLVVSPSSAVLHRLAGVPSEPAS
jgi:hypothetical protein